MIHALEVDIAALQQLPETEPMEPSFVDGGLCLALSLQVGVVSCLIIATCGVTNGQISAPKE